MSLYREHQQIERIKSWACAARFALLAAIAIRLFGDAPATGSTSGDALLMGVAAVTTGLGCWLYPRLSRDLTRFVACVNASESRQAQYYRDATVGRREDLIAGLRAEQTALLTLAAAAARRGNDTVAGYLYGRAKAAESRLRQLDC